MKQQSGFTLIELIAVIVILGIIAAVAVPRFVNLSTAAREASVQGVAGSLGSGSALNHANNIADDAGLTTPTTVVEVLDCEDVAATLDGGLPTGYTITAAAIAAPEGNSEVCTVTEDAGGNTATFTGYRVEP